MIELKTKSDYDLTKNWYRKKEFLDELWKGMKLPTLDPVSYTHLDVYKRQYYLSFTLK